MNSSPKCNMTYASGSNSASISYENTLGHSGLHWSSPSVWFTPQLIFQPFTSFSYLGNLLICTIGYCYQPQGIVLRVKRKTLYGTKN